MCRVGGPRCDKHRHLTPAQRDKRASNRAYRRDLSDAIRDAGYPAIAKRARKASMSSLPAIAEAAGMDPCQVSAHPVPGTGPSRHQVPERDTLLIAEIKAEKMTLTQSSVDLVAEPLSQIPDLLDRSTTSNEIADLTRGSFGMRTDHERKQWHALKARVEDLVQAKVDAEKNGTPEQAHEARMALKDATLAEYMARRHYEAQEDKLAADLLEMMGTDHLSEDYSRPTLGAAREFAHVEEGSADWLNLRKEGLGGSQILAAAGYELGSNGKLKKLSEKERGYALADLLEDKATVATDEDVSPSGSGAAWRGHVWEPALLAQYQKDNPDIRVAVGKATWKGEKDYQVINVDGIALDGDGEPHHLLECKNSDAAHKWENGVPVDYRAQQLYYLEATGLPYADVVARVDGKTQVHRIMRGESIDGTEDGLTINDITPDIDQTWDQVVAFKQVRKKDPAVRPPRPATRKPIGNTGYDTRVACDNLAGLFAGQMTRDEVKEELSARRGTGKVKRPLDTCVRELIAERFDRSTLPEMSGIDIETASIMDDADDPRAFLPRWSDVIETGIVRYDNSGNEIGRLSRLHDADPRIREANGSGAQHVHGISPEDIEGKPQLRDPGENALVRDEILRGGVIVAHNKTFEQNHLHYGLSDFKDRRPWLDTAWLARHFSEPGEGKDGTLRSFCEDNGVEYVNAHRATVDADMMMRALNSFLAKDKWWEVGAAKSEPRRDTVKY